MTSTIPSLHDIFIFGIYACLTKTVLIDKNLLFLHPIRLIANKHIYAKITKQ